MTTIQLDEAIKQVCPIYGVALGNWSDKSTWNIWFKPEATEEQKAAAIAIVNDQATTIDA